MRKRRSRLAKEVDRVVINTGPQVALAKADALPVAASLPSRWLCPPEVVSELEAGRVGDHRNVLPEWLEVLPLARPLDRLARATLDRGEAAVIQLALENGVNWVCIDERRGRRAAASVGLQVVGTLGLLLRAKNLGLVAAVKPFIERLLEAGDWYDAELLEQVLKSAGEELPQ